MSALDGVSNAIGNGHRPVNGQAAATVAEVLAALGAELQPEHPSLAAALSAFQGEVPTIPKRKEAKIRSAKGDYSYKYADLGDVLPVVGPLMAKHGLSWSSKPARDDQGAHILRFVLRHTSGDQDAGDVPLGVPKDCRPQDLGSALTYMRRYAMGAQLGIATDEDDDGGAGQGATSTGVDTAGAIEPTARPRQDTERLTSPSQANMLRAKTSAAKLSKAQLAGFVKNAQGEPAPDLADEEAAEKWLGRWLEKMPARLVDDVIARIAHASAEGSQT